MRKSVDEAYTSSKAADQPPKSFYLIKDLLYYTIIWPSKGVVGVGGTYSLVPLKKSAFPLFPKSKILIFYVPCFSKSPLFS